ncbi:hypothetical protein CPC08DRAFT_763242 [Agrocybe pediades]|nr:hypothetical protein CPC08DRAFT_763242 [Agrocybe pediades]
MSKTMREARSQDTNLMKTEINKALALDPDNKPIAPAIDEAKALRGWKHFEPAHALVPFKHKAQFLKRPTKYRTRAEAGKIEPRLSDLPSFLYPEDAVYRRRRRDKGLFRGHAVIHALRGIYTGESSMVKGRCICCHPEEDDLHLSDDSETEQDHNEPARPGRAVSVPSTRNPPVCQPVPAPPPAPSPSSAPRPPVASSSASPQPQQPAPPRSRSPTPAQPPSPPSQVPKKRRLLRHHINATVDPEDDEEEPEAPSVPPKRSKAAKTPRQTRNKKKTA